MAICFYNWNNVAILFISIIYAILDFDYIIQAKRKLESKTIWDFLVKNYDGYFIWLDIVSLFLHLWACFNQAEINDANVIKLRDFASFLSN